MAKDTQNDPLDDKLCSSSPSSSSSSSSSSASDQSTIKILKRWATRIDEEKLPKSLYVYILLLFAGCFIMLPLLDTNRVAQAWSSFSMMHSHSSGNLLWPFKRRASTIILFYAILLFVAFLATRYMNVSSLGGTTLIRNAIPISKENLPTKSKYPLQCVKQTNETQTCPTDYPTTFEVLDPSTRTCPDYFKWIHEDLRPWKEKGITREMVETAKPLAFFRLLVVDGKVYWEKFHGAYQTRDVFTIWGILQLLRLYPGRLPDLDIMFEAGDVPVIHKTNYTGPDQQANAPPMFHYCGDDLTLDIAFPDWSFWGWPEINIKGWGNLKKDLAEGNKIVPWLNRLPFAFWKGNLFMGERMKLVDCNSTDQWSLQVMIQNWDEETKQGFRSSNLTEQCIHRYKLYIEGIAWSVSEKYILACDSMALLVTPRWYEFFTRSLQPLKHYWPINPNNLCKSIKYAVDWGNKHNEKAQKIGKAGSRFVQQELEMDNVYDYMFHLLNEYGKLLKYKPTVPPGATQTCSEILACSERGLQKKFRKDSMVKAPSKRNPCILPPPQDPQAMQAFIDKQDRVRRKVDEWVAMGNLGAQDPST